MGCCSKPPLETPRQDPPWLLPIVLTIIAVIGLYVGLQQLEGYRNQIDAHERFVPIEVGILQSGIEEKTSSNPNASVSETRYVPTVRYHYIIDGQDYESTRYTFSHVHVTKEQAQEIADLYPANTTAQAFIDPDNPERTVLNADKPKDAWIVIAFFATFGVIIFSAGFIGLRKASKTSGTNCCP